MRSTPLRNLTVVGPEGRTDIGGPLRLMWTAKWDAPVDVSGAPEVRSFPLRTLVLGDTAPLAADGGAFASGLRRVDRFEAPVLLHARLAAGEDAGSAYGLALLPCADAWDSRHGEPEGNRPFLPEPVDVVLQALPDAGTAWPPAGWEDAAQRRGSIEVPPMRLVAGRIPMRVGPRLHDALVDLLGGLGRDARVPRLWLTPQGLELGVERFVTRRHKVRRPQVRWREDADAGLELRFDRPGSATVWWFRRKHAAAAARAEGAIAVRISPKPDGQGNADQVHAAWPLGRVPGRRGLQVLPAGETARQTYTVRHCGLRVAAEARQDPVAGDVAFDVDGLYRTPDWIELRRNANLDGTLPTRLRIGPKAADLLPPQGLTDGDGTGPIELDYDEARLAADLRRWQDSRPDRPLQAFMPLDGGWLQLPHPNLPPVEDADDRERLRPPPDLPAGGIDGALTLRWAGGWLLLRGGSGARVRLARRADGGVDWALYVHGPDLLMRGLMWLAHERPDADDALPTGDPATLSDLELRLRTPPATDAATMAGTVPRSGPLTPWRLRLDGSLTLDFANPDARPTTHLSVEVAPHHAAAATAWLRHPVLPLLSQMPMLRTAAASSRPTGSRQLAPFEPAVAGPLTVRLTVSGTGLHAMRTEGWQRSRAWPWPDTRTSQQNTPTSVAFASVGAPGLVLVPAQDSQAAWGHHVSALPAALRFDLPVLDGLFAAEALPPPEPEAQTDPQPRPQPQREPVAGERVPQTAASAGSPTLAATALDMDALRIHWQSQRRRLSLTRTENAWAVDAFEANPPPADGGPAGWRTVTVPLAPPQVWVARFMVPEPDGTDLGSYRLRADGPGGAEAAFTGESALRGLDGPLHGFRDRTVVGNSVGSVARDELVEDGRGLSHGPPPVGPDWPVLLRRQVAPTEAAGGREVRLATLDSPLDLGLPGGGGWLFAGTDIPLVPTGGGTEWTFEPRPDAGAAWTAREIGRSGFVWRVGEARADSTTDRPRAAEMLLLPGFAFTAMALHELVVVPRGDAVGSVSRLTLDGYLEPVGLGTRRTERTADDPHAPVPAVRITFEANGSADPGLVFSDITVLRAAGDGSGDAVRWPCDVQVACLGATPVPAFVSVTAEGLRALPRGNEAEVDLELQWLESAWPVRCVAQTDPQTGAWTLSLHRDAASMGDGFLALSPTAVSLVLADAVEQIRVIATVGVTLLWGPGVGGTEAFEQLSASSEDAALVRALRWLGQPIEVGLQSAKLQFNPLTRCVSLTATCRTVAEGFRLVRGWPIGPGSVSLGLVARLAPAREGRAVAPEALWLELEYRRDPDPGGLAGIDRIVHRCSLQPGQPMQASLELDGCLELDSFIAWPVSKAWLPDAGGARPAGMTPDSSWRHTARIRLRSHRLDFGLMRQGPGGLPRLATGGAEPRGWCDVFEVEHVLTAVGDVADPPPQWTWQSVQALNWTDADTWLDGLDRRVAQAARPDADRDPRVTRTFLARYRYGDGGPRGIPHPGIADSLLALQGTDGRDWAFHARQRLAGALSVTGTATLWLAGPPQLMHLPFAARADRQAVVPAVAWPTGDGTAVAAFDSLPLPDTGDGDPPTDRPVDVPAGLDAAGLRRAVGVAGDRDRPEGAPPFGRPVEQYLRRAADGAADAFPWRRATAQLAAFAARRAGTSDLRPVTLLVRRAGGAQGAPGPWLTGPVRLGDSAATPAVTRTETPVLVSLGHPQGIVEGPAPGATGGDPTRVLSRHAVAWAALRRDTLSGRFVYAVVPLPVPVARRLRFQRVDALRQEVMSRGPDPQRGWPLEGRAGAQGGSGGAAWGTRVAAVVPWRAEASGLAGWTTDVVLGARGLPAHENGAADAPAWLVMRRLPQYLAAEDHDFNGPLVPWRRTALGRGRLPTGEAVKAALADPAEGKGGDAPEASGSGLDRRTQPFVPERVRVRTTGVRAGIHVAERWQWLLPAAAGAMDVMHPRFGRAAVPGPSVPFQLRTPRPGVLSPSTRVRPWSGAVSGNCVLVPDHACLLQGGTAPVGYAGGPTAAAWAVLVTVTGWDPEPNRAVLQLSVRYLSDTNTRQAANRAIEAALAPGIAVVLDRGTKWMGTGPEWAPEDPAAPGHAVRMLSISMTDTGRPDTPGAGGSPARPCLEFGGTGGAAGADVAAAVPRVTLQIAQTGPDPDGLPRPPLRPATVAFVDHDYDRSLASATAMSVKGQASLHVDRRAYHVSDTVWGLWVAGAQATGELKLFRLPPDSGGRSPAATASGSPPAGGGERLLVTVLVTSGTPFAVALGDRRDANGEVLRPGDLLVLTVTQTNPAGGPVDLDPLQVPIVAVPSVEGPPALYAVLARTGTGVSGTSVPLSAEAPLPTRVSFVDLRKDLEDGLVRRRAVFEWMVPVSGNGMAVWVLKAARNGQMAFPAGTEGGADGFVKLEDNRARDGQGEGQ